VTLGDKLVIGLAGAITLSLYFLFWVPDDSSERRLQIAVVDQPVRTVSLDQNRDLKIKGRLGVSIIEIRNGKARFTHSPCNNKQCIFTGWIQHANELAACLPNGVVLSVVSSDHKFDSINF